MAEQRAIYRNSSSAGWIGAMKQVLSGVRDHLADNHKGLEGQSDFMYRQGTRIGSTDYHNLRAVYAMQTPDFDENNPRKGLSVVIWASMNWTPEYDGMIGKGSEELRVGFFGNRGLVRLARAELTSYLQDNHFPEADWDFHAKVRSHYADSRYEFTKPWDSNPLLERSVKPVEPGSESLVPRIREGLRKLSIRYLPQPVRDAFSKAA